MRIIAYTYDADVHCIYCTKARAQRGDLIVDNTHPHACSLSSSPQDNKDENGLHVNLVDSEGNLVHPVFSTDEHEFTNCGDCHAPL